MMPEMEILNNTDDISPEDARNMVKNLVNRSLKTIDEITYEIGISGKTYYSFMQGNPVGRRTLIKIDKWISESTN